MAKKHINCDFASRVPPRQPEAQILNQNSIFDDFEISDFCPKIDLLVVWEVTGGSGILVISVFFVGF